MSVLDKLKAQAVAGRGLYVSIPITSGWPGDVGRFMPTDPHMTIHHFGKKNSEERVEKIHAATLEALDAVGMRKSVPSVELTGVGFLYQRDRTATPVALVNCFTICSFRDELVRRLTTAEIEVSTYFGFIPHVTLDLHDSYSNHDVAMSMINGRKTPCVSPGVFLVCGDERVRLTDEPVF